VQLGGGRVSLTFSDSGDIICRITHIFSLGFAIYWFHINLSPHILQVHLPEGVHTFEVSNRREKYVCILFISKYLYIHQWILFSKSLYACW